MWGQAAGLMLQLEKGGGAVGASRFLGRGLRSSLSAPVPPLLPQLLPRDPSDKCVLPATPASCSSAEAHLRACCPHARSAGLRS